jgi:hypothetical protein
MTKKSHVLSLFFLAKFGLEMTLKNVYQWEIAHPVIKVS